MPEVNGRQFLDSRDGALGHVTFVGRNGSLMHEPDLNSPGTAPVGSFDELRGHLQRKTAHRWDSDNSGFRRAKVTSVRWHDRNGASWEFPRGGSLEDGRRVD